MRVTESMTVTVKWYEDGCVEAILTGPVPGLRAGAVLQLGLESTPMSALHQLGRQLQVWYDLDETVEREDQWCDGTPTPGSDGSEDGVILVLWDERGEDPFL